MNTQLVGQIERAVFNEAYVFSPYRPPAPPNRQRVTAEAVMPPGAAGEGSGSQIEAQCVVRAPGSSSVDVHVRFLHLVTRCQAETWRNEAIERVVTVHVTLADGCCRPVRESFRWPGRRTEDLLLESLRGDVEAFVEPAAAGQAGVAGPGPRRGHVGCSRRVTGEGNDQETGERPLPAVLAQEGSQDRPPSEPRHVRDQSRG